MDKKIIAIIVCAVFVFGLGIFIGHRGWQRAQGTVADLRANLSEAESRIESLESNIDSARTTVDDLRAELEREREEYSKLEDQIEIQRDIIDGLTTGLGEIKGSVGTITDLAEEGARIVGRLLEGMETEED